MFSTYVLLALLNSSRVNPLVLDQELVAVANTRVEYLCTHPFSHEGWRDFRKNESGLIGENLAKDFRTEKATHKALMKSPTHKANILEPRYKRVGIAHKCNITVEVFGQ